jgi:hypothetical protein
MFPILAATNSLLGDALVCAGQGSQPPPGSIVFQLNNNGNVVSATIHTWELRMLLKSGKVIKEFIPSNFGILQPGVHWLAECRKNF